MSNIGSQAPVFQGTWSDQSYLRGDLVLRSGVLYQAVTDTSAQPGATTATPGKGNPVSWVDVTALVLDFTGSDDPTTGAGIPSAISSTYHMAGTGLYVKTGAGATGWTDATAGASFNGGTITDPLTIEDAGANGLFVKVSGDLESGVKAQTLDLGAGVVAANMHVRSNGGGGGFLTVDGQTPNGEGATLNDYGGLALFTAADRKGIEAWDGPGNTLRFGLLPTGGHVVIGTTDAPPDGDLSASQVAFWFDDTNGAAKLKIKGKSANGTVVTGTVNLT